MAGERDAFVVKHQRAETYERFARGSLGASHGGSRWFESRAAHIHRCADSHSLVSPGKTGVFRFWLQRLATQFRRLPCRILCRAFSGPDRVCSMCSSVTCR